MQVIPETHMIGEAPKSIESRTSLVAINKYSGNWKLLSAKYSGKCNFCNKIIYKTEQIYWHLYSKEIQHKLCFEQNLKKFKTKFDGKCIICKKSIYHDQESFFNVCTRKIQHIQCTDIEEHIFDFEMNNEKEFVDGAIELAQQKSNSKITVTFNNKSKSTCVNKFGNTYLITLNGSIPIKAGMCHELSHVVYDSLTTNTWSKLHVLIKYIHDKYNANMGDFIKSTFNIMEDIRIESWDVFLNPDRKAMYDNLCTLEGVKMHSVDNPSDELLAYRFKRLDLVSNNHINEIEHIWTKCTLATSGGIFKILKKWIDHGSLHQLMELAGKNESLLKKETPLKIR